MKKETKWSIDQSHSTIEFKVRHLMIAHVKGNFKTFEASIYTFEKDFSSVEIDLWIDVNSIDTGDENRDTHLKSIDFFDVEHYQQITFIANTMVSPNEDNNYELWGELTIKGITQNVKFNVEFGGIITDPWGNEKAGLTLSSIINRVDFGLTWNASIESGGFMVSDEVKISCEIEVTNLTNQTSKMVLETTK